MFSFSIDKQRDQVNVEWMSRPVDTLKSKTKSTACLGLDIHGTVTYFCFRLEKETFDWPNNRGSLHDYRSHQTHSLLTDKKEFLQNWDSESLQLTTRMTYRKL